MRGLLEASLARPIFQAILVLLFVEMHIIERSILGWRGRACAGEMLLRGCNPLKVRLAGDDRDSGRLPRQVASRLS